MGCLTLLIIGFLGIIALVGTGWYFLSHTLDSFTSSSEEEIVMPAISEPEATEAEGKFDQLTNALRTKQATTFTFTAAELNALSERHPDFIPRKGRMRFAIADSLATVDMSFPLGWIGWSHWKNRWFNGTANFGFIYADEGFRFDANSIEANGHRFSGSSLSYAKQSFDKTINRGFENWIREEGIAEMWRNVKTMTLDDDKLVIITRGE